MMAWLRKERRTRTPVHNAETGELERQRGRALAYRLTGALLTLAQLLLWLLWQAYDGAGQAVWQAVALLALPLLGLWGLWAGTDGARGGRAPAARAAGGAQVAPAVASAEKAAALLLLPCLMLDLYFLLSASFGLMRSMIPSFPNWACGAVVTVFPLLSAWEGRKDGVAYGAHALRTVLAALFLLAAPLTFADARPERLWPLWGGGMGNTAWVALGGAGTMWGVALLFLPPRLANRDEATARAPLPGGGKPAGLLFALLPLTLCLVWALWLAMTRPWLPGDGLGLGRKLVALSRYSASILICEAGALFWMLLLPICLCGCLSCGDQLIKQAAPKLPRALRLLAALLPGAVGLCLRPEALLAAALALSPYRSVLSAAAAVLLLVSGKKGGRAS